MGQKFGAYGREEDRQIMYKRNIEARSHNHCCRRKVISITSSVALIIQHAKHMRCVILICGLSASTLFFHTISQTVRLSEKIVVAHKMCFDFLYNVCLKDF